jgi:hypothetical protein
MSSRRKIWAGLTLFVVILFAFMIPVHVFAAHPILYALIGGILLVITLGQTLGEFDSIYELFEKDVDKSQQSAGRRLAPLAILPGILFAGILIYITFERKDEALEKFGTLTKGTVVNGSSTTTTRRFQKNTSYDIMFLYQDSTGRKYQFEQSVNGSEFSDSYVGQEVDIVYSKKNPSLAKAVLDLDELSKYKKIADNRIEVQQLIAILESHQSDTIVNFLNNISYQWTKAEADVYSNEKRKLAIKVFPGNQELAYMDNSRGGFDQSDQNFETSMEACGFKKKAVTANNETQELYYTDKYGVSKESKMVEGEGGALGFTMVTIYHLFRLEGE